MPTKTLRTTATELSRLDRVVQQLTGLSRAGVRGLLDHGCVQVNALEARLPQQEVRTGDQVRIDYDPHRRYKERPALETDPAYAILHEDEHVIVVNKAAHILTVPTASGKGKTLIEALQRHINRGKPPPRWRKLHVVHRLDQGVSGVLVVAKTASAAARLKDQFAAHKPDRVYIAVVNGAMEQRKGTFRSHLATDYSLNRYSTKRHGHGELAITHWEAVSGRSDGATKRRPGSDEGGRTRADFTVVRVRLETGRRNQIRVHFAEAGHPVLGDPRYPRAPRESDPAAEITSAHPKWRAKRLALHAQSLEFEHPATGKIMRFEAEVPTEFQPFVSGRR